MSVLNSNNTFDGLDEPVRPTHGGRKRRLDKENHKKQQKRRFSGDALIPTVGCQFIYFVLFCFMHLSFSFNFFIFKMCRCSIYKVLAFSFGSIFSCFNSTIDCFYCPHL